MSNNKPEVKPEEKHTRLSKARTKLTEQVKKITPKLKKIITKLREIILKLKEKLGEISSKKTTRKHQNAKQEEELALGKKTRKQHKANSSSENTTRKQQKAKQKAEKKKNKKPKRRAFPIWLRIIVVLLLCTIAVVLGAIVGYGIVGSGKPSDALDMDTWRHIVELVTKTE